MGSINLDAIRIQRIFFAAMEQVHIDIISIAQNSRTSARTLSIVVPAYNEADNLADAIHMITSGIPSSVIDHEIIIIDDGSHDSTPEIIRQLEAANSKIHGIFHVSNQGKGAALLSGFKTARMEWVLFTDADLQIHISELPLFLEQSDSHDMIIGYRQGRSDPFTRQFFSRIFSGIIHITLGFTVRDLNCPFKLIRRAFLDSCNLQSKGFFIDSELMHAAFGKRARIKELGVSCQPRQKGKSTVRFRHVVETVRELFDLLGRKDSNAR